MLLERTILLRWWQQDCLKAIFVTKMLKHVTLLLLCRNTLPLMQVILKVMKEFNKIATLMNLEFEI